MTERNERYGDMSLEAISLSSPLLESLETLEKEIANYREITQALEMVGDTLLPRDPKTPEPNSTTKLTQLPEGMVGKLMSLTRELSMINNDAVAITSHLRGIVE